MNVALFLVSMYVIADILIIIVLNVMRSANKKKLKKII